MDNKKYGLAEEYIKKNLPKSIEDVYKKSETEFKEAIPSAIDHTTSLLDTDAINRASIQDALNNGSPQGQSNTNNKTRVRTMGGASPFMIPPSNQTPAPETKPIQNYNMGNYPSDDSSVWRNSGYTETMILIGTGILVLLVFMVTYLMLNYFG